MQTSGIGPFVAHAPEFAGVVGEQPRLIKVVDTNAHEGPVYVAHEDALYFTSVPRVIDAPAPGEDAIDGLKVDQAGNLYVCGPGGIWILGANGQHLGTLKLPESPHNPAWGDADGQTLYVTALTSIYRVRLNISGIRPQ